MDTSPAGSATSPLTAPFVYFGGKRKVAPEVWSRLGNVDNYVEPFGGSLAILLARPTEHEWWLRKETCGDYSGHVVNFYRALVAEPKELARYANWPVTEADLTSRHLFLVRYQNDLAEKLTADPLYYDVQAAGWWVWGISCWVGGDWMSGLGPWRPGKPQGPGVYRKMPMIAGSHGGKGIHKPLAKLKKDSDDSPPILQEEYLEAMITDFTKIADRLRRVRIACGDWKRLQKAASDAGPKKISGIFLDPPYDLTMRRGDLYGDSDSAKGEHLTQVHTEARDWALSIGSDPYKRIAYCSYATDEEETLFSNAGWSKYQWMAQGGYGLQSDNEAKENREKEVIWFSPHCLPSAKKLPT